MWLLCRDGGRGAEARERIRKATGSETVELALLATIVTDRSAGVAFFGDETRLERDLLSDAAKAYLLRLFGRLGAD